MPTYEYVCRSCGHLFEIVQAMTDPSLIECPECGGPLRKVFAPPAISFKGSGFYTTDHRGKPRTRPDAKPSEETPSGTSTPGSKPSEPTPSDTKPHDPDRSGTRSGDGGGSEPTKPASSGSSAGGSGGGNGSSATGRGAAR